MPEVPGQPKSEIKCTLRQEEDNKNIEACSSNVFCYKDGYKNDMCKNPRESCLSFKIFKLSDVDLKNKELRTYKKLDGICLNPTTVYKYDLSGEGMELDSSATDEATCESICTKDN